MGKRDAAWLGWPVIAALVGAIIAVFTLRHGVVPGGDGVSYWSASVNVSHGHLLRSSLVPSFSDLSFRDLLEHGRAPFVDFPLGYPLIVGTLGAVFGVIHVQVAAMVAAVGATCGLFVLGPERPAAFPALTTRMLMAWIAIAVPLAVQLRQGALPEPVFVAGLLAFALALLRMRAGRGSVWSAAIIGGVLGVLRFVGLPLVAVLAVESWRAGARRWHLVRPLLVCGIPGLANAWWASRITSRQPQWMDRAAIDYKFAAHSIAGWFTTSRTAVDDVLSGPWHVPPLYYLIAAVTLLTISVGAVLWLRRDRTIAEPSVLLAALAAALLVAVLITMFFYDALTKFEPRMLYPPAVLCWAALAWSPTVARRRWSAALALCWAISASWPTHWKAPTFVADPARVQAARSLEARVLISNSADLVHYETGIPAAYFPPPIKVHSARPQDRDALMVGFSCALYRADGAVLLDGSGYLPADPWVVDYMDRFAVDGELLRTVVGPFTTYVPLAAACGE